MDHIEEAKKLLENAKRVGLQSSEALVAIGHALVAIAEEMEKARVERDRVTRAS